MIEVGMGQKDMRNILQLQIPSVHARRHSLPLRFLKAAVYQDDSLIMLNRINIRICFVLHAAYLKQML